MGAFLKVWSYLVNPLFIPSIISFWYFQTMSVADPAESKHTMYLILILTAAIPLAIFWSLKALKIVSSVHLSTPKERLTPLACYCILIIILLRTTFLIQDHLSLYIFFVGVLLSSMVAFFLAIFKFKISLHLMAIGGTLGFMLMLAIVMGVSVFYLILVLVVVAGITASSRLYLKAHDGIELTFGFLTGIVAQVLAMSYFAQEIAQF